MSLSIGAHVGTPDIAELSRAETLLARSFSRSGLAMESAYLGWLLAERRDALPPLWVTATQDEVGLAGWALGSPVGGEIEGHKLDGHLVSCVAVDPSAQGAGVGSALYRVLLEGLKRVESEFVITFAVSGSIGERLLRSAYANAGWTESSLGTLESWGMLGRRIRSPLEKGCRGAHDDQADLLHPRNTTDWHRHLRTDPRGRALIGGGASAVRAHNWTDGPGSRYILVEYLPPVGDAHLLAELLGCAFRVHAEHSDRLIIPNLPEWGIQAASSIGLRRVPATPYAAYYFSPPGNRTWPVPTWTTFAVT
jgi:GNAT superfamily N-acetyltransferase